MKIRLVGAELFHADGRTGRRTYMTMLSLSAILQKRLKTSTPRLVFMVCIRATLPPPFISLLLSAYLPVLAVAYLKLDATLDNP